ncbi:MAG: dehydrogenase, partial [Candidatus Saccharimonas sp.]|nr:dehydrogenase [Planctomycetaceae bacterium]
PSGIAVGHGGVWVANSPDILFVQDTDGDGKADKQEVVVTGFGRADTHELPNSLTWGPDGWLYGLNGVFNYSHVKYSETNPNYKADHKGWPITCAMFRIHPRTREFQVFCEGTSNPWGIAFNDEGEAFVSACVIDHLWHLVETGYYHRQGGPYPPFTWKIDSIVKHKHQKAAYCGIHYFDSDAYPEQYRGKLYMGNIHGGCINVDRIERDGSTYKGFGEPDFLTANDAWFMPVVQKTGPDGCLYILDWYDRYHCYQDANRDPAGIDRLKGRLYRVRYKDSPRTPKGFDLAKESDEQLNERLGAKNDFIRWTATRLLQERGTNAIQKKIEVAIGAKETSQLHRAHAVFVLAGLPYEAGSLRRGFATETIRQHVWAEKKVTSATETLLAWSYRISMQDEAATRFVRAFETAEYEAGRLFGNEDYVGSAILARELVISIARGPRSPMGLHTLMLIVTTFPEDPMLPKLAWQALHPRLESETEVFLEVLQKGKHLNSKPVLELIPRIADRILGRQKFDAQPIGKLFALLRDDHPQAGRQVLEVISAKVQSGELKGEKLDQLKVAMAEPLTTLLADKATHPLASDAALLAASWGD